MPRERAFWLVLATLAIGGLALGMLQERRKEVQATFAAELGVSQPAPAARRFQRRTFHRVVKIAAGKGGALVRPTALRPAPAGEILVIDSGARTVRWFTVAGALRHTCGPEGLVNPTDAAVGPGETLWVADPAGRRLVLCSPDGTIQQTITVAPPALRLVLGKTDLVALAPGEEPGAYRRLKLDGTPLGAFGRLFEEPGDNALTADGWLASDGQGGFVHFLRHAGLIVGWTNDGRLRFAARTADGVPPPIVSVESGDRFSIARDRPRASLSGSIAEGEIWVLSGPPGERVLDVYEAATGTYRASYSPPEDALFALRTGELLWTVTPAGVTAWRSTSFPDRSF